MSETQSPCYLIKCPISQEEFESITPCCSGVIRFQNVDLGVGALFTINRIDDQCFRCEHFKGNLEQKEV